MCGIAGQMNLGEQPPPREKVLRQMLALLRHRGPDQFGLYLEERVGMASARLSVVDLENGQQPIASADGTRWIVFNGEIFNHRELRAELESRGHNFASRSDTEVLLHVYEEWGWEGLRRLNGQFAVAIWDHRRQELFLARDRLGVRPLFYALSNGTFLFASEIKALFAAGILERALDPVILLQVFSFWSPVGGTHCLSRRLRTAAGSFSADPLRQAGT